MTIMCGRLVSGPLMTRKTMTLMLNSIHNRKVTKRNTMKKMKTIQTIKPPILPTSMSGTKKWFNYMVMDGTKKGFSFKLMKKIQKK